MNNQLNLFGQYGNAYDSSTNDEQQSYGVGQECPITNPTTPQLPSLSHYDYVGTHSGTTSESGDKDSNEYLNSDRNPQLEPLQSRTPINNYIPHYDYSSISSINSSFTGDTEHFETQVPVNYPRFQDQGKVIYIPTKVERILNDRISKKRMEQIHPDVKVAIELTLLLLSNLSNAFYSSTNDGWKSLKAEYMRDQVSFTYANTYRKILDLLIEGTSNGPIINVQKGYVIGQKTRRYRLSDAYRNKGVVPYHLTTDMAVKLRKRAFFNALKSAISNPIALNCISSYEQMELPSVDEVMAHGRTLAKEGYRNKKGLILTFQGKHSKTEFKNPEERVWLEEQVELYDRLTTEGLLVPRVADGRGGGRVVDSFTLMPAWIRSMVKMNGKTIEEYDYSCLHPNLASQIFGGTGQAITHQQIADYLQIDIVKAKVANLSFFNSPLPQMMNSVLWAYYSDNEPEMIKNLLAHRDASGLPTSEKHKATSQIMFETEVKLMTEVINRLNDKGIYTMYLYDALSAPAKNKTTIVDIMNQVAIDSGIATTAK